jgi:DNA-binding transcriptional ArsR family regulator
MSTIPPDRETNFQEGGVKEHPKLIWDIGTAYDFFMSLQVLFHPDEFGLRASWAAGVRSRLPAAERKLLEDIQNFLWLPMHWVYTLPAPKDAATALWSLRQTPPAQRPLVLSNPHETTTDVVEMFRNVVERRKWDDQDLEVIRGVLLHHKKTDNIKDLPIFLDWMARPAELGELYLSAMQSYYQEYFGEEERRIAPVLHESLIQAQTMAERLSLPELLSELSQGIHFDEPLKVSKLVLVPGYWNTPLIVCPMIGPDEMVFMFGARPVDMSLIPGEPVPDTLLRVLKALADPTRLRILNFLSQDALTPAQLSRKLRLRAPTVTHHLSALRLAGLVHVSLQASGEKNYTCRAEALKSAFDNLEKYIKCGSAEDNEA